VSDLDFGLSVIEDDSFFYKVAKVIKEKDWMNAQHVLHEAYDVSSGIFNHMQYASLDKTLPLESRRPLSSVELHPAEDMSLSSSYTPLLNRYVDAKVYDYFHLNINEFLDLTQARAEEILKVCNEKLVADNAKQKGILDNLSRNASGLIK
jgi:hypothetical protein